MIKSKDTPQANRFSIITLFPELFSAFQKEGIVGRAIQAQALTLETIFLRDFAPGPRRNVDAHVVGTSDGMALKADVTASAIESVLTLDTYVIHMTPAGKVFHHDLAKELAQKKHLLFLCGRYAGFDARVVKKYAHLELSIGDFILAGGELPAMCVIESVARFLPAVLGNSQSAENDSFADGLLEAPQYAKPDVFEGMPIPGILSSGDHQKIAKFNRREQIEITAQRRPDLLLRIWDQLTPQEKKIAEKIWKHVTPR